MLPLPEEDARYAFAMFPSQRDQSYLSDSPSPIDPPHDYYPRRRISDPDPAPVSYPPRPLHRAASLADARDMSHDLDPSGKTYSFVSLPGNVVKKRPRRRYDEIERLYHCSFPDCNKAYGTLNHLNAHVTMQKHGPKRSPAEFKELRKQWRKAKKEQEAGLGLGMPSTRLSSSYSSPTHHDPHHIYHQSQRYQAPYPLPLDTSFGGRYSVSAESGPLTYSPHSAREDDYPVTPQDHQWPPYSPTGYQYYSPSTPSPSTPTYHHLPPSPVRSASGPVSGLPYPFPQQPPLQSYARQERHHQHHYSEPRHQLPHDLDLHSNRSLSHSPPRSHNSLPPDSTLLTPLQGYESQQAQSTPDLRYDDGHPSQYHQ